MVKRTMWVCALALASILPNLPTSAQGDRQAAAEAYAGVVDYPLLIEKAATRRAAELPSSERDAFIEFITKEVDFEMTRFYAIIAMVDLFEQRELQALASFAATPEGRSALAKLPALGAVLTPIVERQIEDAERRLPGPLTRPRSGIRRDLRGPCSRGRSPANQSQAQRSWSPPRSLARWSDSSGRRLCRVMQPQPAA